MVSTNSENYQLRLAVKSDSQRVWQIRNHPLVRSLSNNQEVINFEAHDVWFNNKYFGSGENLCYVLESSDKNVVGYCRLDLGVKDSQYIISIAIDPENHGKGLGSLLLSGTLGQYQGSRLILAEIKKDNVISFKLFLKNNFVVQNEDENNFYLVYGR